VKVSKTAAGFRITTGDKSASFTIGAYGSNAEQDVSRFEDGAHVWCVSAIDKLRALAIIGPNGGFAEATPKLAPILAAAGIIPKAAPAAASPSPAPVTTTAANPAPAAAPPKMVAPAVAATSTPTPPAHVADSPEAVAARTNGTRPSAANEQVLADNGWDQILAKLNHRRT